MPVCRRKLLLVTTIVTSDSCAAVVACLEAANLAADHDAAGAATTRTLVLLGVSVLSSVLCILLTVYEDRVQRAAAAVFARVSNRIASVCSTRPMCSHIPRNDRRSSCDSVTGSASRPASGQHVCPGGHP